MNLGCLQMKLMLPLRIWGFVNDLYDRLDFRWVIKAHSLYHNKGI